MVHSFSYALLEGVHIQGGVGEGWERNGIAIEIGMENKNGREVENGIEIGMELEIAMAVENGMEVENGM